MDAERDHADEAPIPVTQDGVVITPFSAIAAVLPRDPLDDIAMELHKLVIAVRDSEANKPSGSVVMTLTVQRSTVDGAVILAAEVKSKLPKEPRPGGLLFVDDDGNLSTRNPRQKDFFERPKGV
jgi:hypothetical protein